MSWASKLGDAALFFALAWAATAHGGHAAGIVVAALNFSRTALLIVGGVVGDRFSPRHVLIATNIAMLFTNAALVIYVTAADPTILGLALLATVIGALDAFFLPVTGSMPRRLVSPEQLPRAMALNQTGTQLIGLIGGTVGGALVALGGLALVAGVDAITFAVGAVFVAFFLSLRDTRDQGTSENVLAQAASGISLVTRHAVLRPALILTGVIAGVCLPVTILLIPLIARQENWGAVAAGIAVGGQALGAMVITIIVSRGTIAPRPGLVAAASCGPIALGTVIVAFAHGPVVAIVGSTVIGLGVGMFATHLGPLVLRSSPETHLARVQSLITLVQSSALTATVWIMGFVVDRTSVTAVALTAAVIVLVAGLASLAVPALRQARSDTPGADDTDDGADSDAPGGPTPPVASASAEAADQRAATPPTRDVDLRAVERHDSPVPPAQAVPADRSPDNDARSEELLPPAGANTRR